MSEEVSPTIQGVAVSNFTLQEINSMIRWRKDQIKSIARIANFLTSKQLVRYEKFADEIKILEQEKKDRKNRISKL